MSLYESDGVHIAAAGNGERIRTMMSELGFPPNFPKHLLPIGENNEGTLIGRVIQQALQPPVTEQPIVYANENNVEAFRQHPEVGPYARIVIGSFDNSLGPFIANVTHNERRTLGCAGDFYADFSWDKVLDAHESHGFPLTFMVGRTIEVDGGAVFDVADNLQIKRLRRADRTSNSEFINVGVYIFDPTKKVLEILNEMTKKAKIQNVRLKEDLVVHAMINHGLAGAYVLPSTPFNVNTSETYKALLAHTREQSDRSSPHSG